MPDWDTMECDISCACDTSLAVCTRLCENILSTPTSPQHFSLACLVMDCVKTSTSRTGHGIIGVKSIMCVTLKAPPYVPDLESASTQVLSA